jgi:DNA primase
VRVAVPRPELQDLEFRQLVQRIKDRSPIEAFVGERVPGLKKKGRLYVACCPFHDERTPSFKVDPERATWRCYGACGEGGDVISFLQRHDGLAFREALEVLAQACGEELPASRAPRRSAGEEERLKRRHEVLERAARFYERALTTPDGSGAREYLAERGLADETCARFRIGWAPAGGRALLTAAGSSGLDTELLVETGLAGRGDDGHAYDFFRGRLMIPICDREGRVVGFGARLLPRDTRPDDHRGKYVNTPDTPLFHKGRLIYGLDLATAAVRKTRELVLVEGYTDVMAAHQQGRENVAAVLGTSTTQDHAALVRRSGAERVVLVFDGDAAGTRASERALAGLLPLGRRVDVATLPAGVDPCDLLLEQGDAGFTALLDGAADWFTWRVDALRGLTGAELARGVDEVLALIERLPRPVEREQRAQELAQTLGLTEGVRMQWTELKERARLRAQALEARTVEEPAEPAPPSRSPSELVVLRAHAELVGALLLDNSLIPVHRDELAEIRDDALRAVADAVLELYDHGDIEAEVDASAVMTQLGENPVRDRVMRIEALAATAESPADAAHGARERIQREKSKHRRQELRQRLEAATHDPEQRPDWDALREFQEEKRKLAVPSAGTAPTPASEGR